ncbi:MAG TPA: cupin domain-containing protein [Candidatus Thermoplasmatota archaeon]|nr:cupin domain-containing protein [Candidatus Thermoplasmatota archaeon]
MRRTTHAEVPAFTTKDGSIIRELMHPDAHAARQQSLAEATVPPGRATTLHRHARSEELYHLLRGEGEMTLGDEAFRVRAGDTVCISPGVAHRIRNVGPEPLVLLCCCAPAYSDEDTELLE